MKRIMLVTVLSITALAAVVLSASANASSQRERGTPATIKVNPPQWKAGSMSRDGAGQLIVKATSQRGDTLNPERFAFLKDYPPATGKACGERRVSGHLDARAPANVKSIVNKLAPDYDLDPRLVLAVIAVESNFHAGAVSPKNAQGLMQLIPDTAKRFGVRDPFNPSDNIRGGMLYLRWLLKTFNGNVSLALAGYNAGEKAVEKHKGVPPYNETRQYVQKVHKLYGCASGGVLPTNLAASGLGAANDAWQRDARAPYDLWNAAQSTVEQGSDSRCRFRVRRDAGHHFVSGLSTSGSAVCR